PYAAREDRRDEDRPERARPPHGGGPGRAGRDGLLEAGARPADRSEHHRADALARPGGDPRRALEPRPDPPRHGRRDLAARRALRAPGAAGLGRRPSPPAL